jgi:hypothetical protein
VKVLTEERERSMATDVLTELSQKEASWNLESLAPLESLRDEFNARREAFVGAVRAKMEEVVKETNDLRDVWRLICAHVAAGYVEQVHGLRDRYLRLCDHEIQTLRRVLDLARDALRDGPEVGQLETEFHEFGRWSMHLAWRWRTAEDLKALATESTEPNPPDAEPADIQAAMEGPDWQTGSGEAFLAAAKAAFRANATALRRLA